MRKPTPIYKLLKWHSDAMAGKSPAIHDGDPQMGWFKVRMVRGGPFVPGRIWIHREVCLETGELTCDERFSCTIGDENHNPYKQWVWLAKNPISKPEYEELCQLHQSIKDMAATHARFDLSRNVIRP